MSIRIPLSISPEPASEPTWQEEETEARELLLALVERIDAVSCEDEDPWLPGRLGRVLEDCKEFLR